MTSKMYRKITTAILCVSLISSPATLYAQDTSGDDTVYKLDLRITSLSEGTPAPFSGILLTTDSLTKMQVEFEKKIASMSIDLSYKDKAHKLEILSLNNRIEQEVLFRTTQINMRDAYIEELEAKFLEKDDLSPWWITASFTVGCLTTIAIAYSLQPAYN